MAQANDEIKCPIEYALEIFGGKWKPRILCLLAEMEKLRYCEIRSEMVNVTDAVLASALKELISDNLINRKQYGEIPPKVEYSLTEKGKSVLPILQSICEWSKAFSKDTDIKLKRCQKCDYKVEV